MGFILFLPMTNPATGVFQIVYRSIAKEGLTQVDVKSILNSSRKNNPALGVTGLLVLRDGFFLQLLEGGETAVRSLVERIKKDSRHTGFTVLAEISSGERIFTQWSMGYLDPASAPPTLDTVTLNKIHDMAVARGKPVPAATIRSILSTFRAGSTDLSAIEPA